MKLFFSADSWMYRLLGRVVDLFVLNILFILTSLPIVTIGVSLTALYTVTLKIVQDEDSSVISAYFKAFGENFKRGLILSLIFIALGSALTFSFLTLPSLNGISFIIGLFGSVLLLLLLGIEFIYLFPYTARYNDHLVNALKVSIQIPLLNLKTTFILLGLLLAIGLFATFSNVTFALVTFLLLILGFSGVAVIISYFTLNVFQKYENE